MANKKQLQILKKGSSSWNTWRLLHGDDEINLEGEDLRDEYLSASALFIATHVGANLRGADLYAADLTSECQVRL